MSFLVFWKIILILIVKSLLQNGAKYSFSRLSEVEVFKNIQHSVSLLGCLLNDDISMRLHFFLFLGEILTSCLAD